MIALNLVKNPLEIRVVLHILQLGIVNNGNIEMVRDHLLKNENLRYFFLGAHIYFKVDLFANIGIAALPILADEHYDGESYGLQRHAHRQEIERIRIKRSHDRHIARIDEDPEEKKYSIECEEDDGTKL